MGFKGRGAEGGPPPLDGFKWDLTAGPPCGSRMVNISHTGAGSPPGTTDPTSSASSGPSVTLHPP